MFEKTLQSLGETCTYPSARKYRVVDDELGASYPLFEDRNGETINYKLTSKLNHSLFVTGASGYGKTVTCRRIIEEEIKRGALVLIDNGKGENMKFENEKKFSFVERNIKLKPSLMAHNDWRNMMNLSENAAYELRYAIKNTLDAKAPINETSIKYELNQRGTAKELKAKILNAINDIYEEGYLSESDGINLRKEWQEHQVLHFDTSHEPSMRCVLIPHLCRQIRKMKDSSHTAFPDKKIIILFDEACDPEFGVARQKLPRQVFAPIHQIFSLGRIWNVFGIANTQQPQDMNPAVISNCPHKIIHNISYHSALKRISDICKLSFNHVKRRLPYLRKGECLFLSENYQQYRKVLFQHQAT